MGTRYGRGMRWRGRRRRAGGRRFLCDGAVARGPRGPDDRRPRRRRLRLLGAPPPDRGGRRRRLRWSRGEGREATGREGRVSSGLGASRRRQHGRFAARRHRRGVCGSGPCRHGWRRGGGAVRRCGGIRGTTGRFLSGGRRGRAHRGSAGGLPGTGGTGGFRLRGAHQESHGEERRGGLRGRCCDAGRGSDGVLEHFSEQG
mmetsp:Transcript_27873/g.55867  ORF Transcript_27873/g.55867 Transcript_27873/m.55867 type:complete len:201 (+) Transcript_27873:284-886(+)